MSRESRAQGRADNAATRTAELEVAERQARLGAQHARRHLALLAQGSRALVAGLDDEADALRSLAAVIVPSFADWCAIDGVEDGQVRRMAAAHADPAAASLLPGLLAELPGWAAPIRRVMATAQAELVWDVAEPPVLPDDADHRALLRALGLTSTLTVPIRIQGLSVGAITCATAPGRRGYRPSDVAAVEELAARTALTLERIALYQETQRSSAETAERAGQLRRLVEVALALQPQHTALGTAEVVAGQACRLVGARHSLVSLCSATGGPVRVTAGGAGPWSKEHVELVERAEAGDAGEACTLVDPGTGAVEALAVRLNDRSARAIGTLVVAGKESGTLTDDDASILVALAQLASAALDNARLHESVRAGEAHLRALVEASPLAILELDLAGRVRLSNSAAVRLLGGDEGPTGEAGAADRPLALHPETAALLGRLAADTLAGQPVTDLEVVARRVDGSEVPVSLAGAGLQDPAGAVEGVVVMAADLTARRRLEEQLVRAQRIEAVGQVAGGVAHDFNNLLTVILGHAHLLEAVLAEGDSRRDDAQAITRAAERAADVTAQLLTISRGDPVVSEAFDPRHRLGRLAETLRSLLPESVDFDVSVGPGKGLVRLSPAQFDQAVLNLAVNARDALSGTGRLRISLWEEAGSVVIAVADTGTGMDAETAERCFEPFFSTKGRGTGLGLATVHSVVTGAGGQVSLSTAPGEGTTFTVWLPRVAGQVAGAVPARPQARAGFERILLVEDEAGLRRLAVEALRGAGYVVTPAVDGQAALYLLDADGTPPDLVVTDVVMPRVGGVELAERLAVLYPEVPVLFMTGYVDQTSREGLVGADVLIKPFVVTELVGRVEDALDRASAERRGPGPGAGTPAQGSKR